MWQLKTLLSWYGFNFIHPRVFSHYFTSTLVSKTTFWCMHTASYSYICPHYLLFYYNILSWLENKASGDNHLIKHRPKWSVIPAGMPSQILMRIAVTRGDRRNVIFIPQKLLILVFIWFSGESYPPSCPLELPFHLLTYNVSCTYGSSTCLVFYFLLWNNYMLTCQLCLCLVCITT